MKKYLLVLLALIIVFSAASFIIVPAVLTIDEKITISASPQATSRVLQNDAYWFKWWPDSSQGKLIYKNSTYHVREKLYNQFKIDIQNRSDSIRSVLNILPQSLDTVQMEWIAVLKSSTNPFTRMRQFFSNKERRNEIRSILSSMQKYMSKQVNIYGVDMHREVVSDTLMVSIKREFSNYPTVSQVDSMIQLLRKYVYSKDAKAVDSPMLHVDSFSNNKFTAQVAIPTDKKLESSGEIEFRRMVRGYMIIADVKGGQATVTTAIAEIGNMLGDYLRTSPAIPFELMLTDRAKEPDTTKWITRIYYPVVL